MQPSPEGYNLFRSIFPSFEKPVERPQFLNIQQDRRHFRAIGAVLLIAAGSGVGMALWEQSHKVPARSMAALAATPALESTTSEITTAGANGDDDQSAPTVKQSAFCSQRTSARRACADVKALKEARLTAPAKPEPAAKPAAVAKQPSPAAQASVMVAAEPVSVAAPVVTPKKQAAPKVAKRRSQENAPGERLVHVYDQMTPDGRRVPVYRRVVRGAYETGVIEYRSTRRANLEQPSGRYFSLQ